ncbi:hypothetical protein C4D60_Mb01t12030 [Musa balbisiana]|uniref:Uncharacterized protein n=1 Tax=Musa balbisiana TaxID=52838 RepID=A0A4S8JMH0_MUSBA|nr:hypothetical protein C4D60_Mb01t12030 [Musa balbisiana]
MSGVGWTFQWSITVRRLTTSNRDGATALIGSRRNTLGGSSFLQLYVLPKTTLFRVNEKLTWQTTQNPQDIALRSTSPNAMTMDSPTLKPQANTSADITIFAIVQYAIRQSSREQMGRVEIYGHSLSQFADRPVAQHVLPRSGVPTHDMLVRTSVSTRKKMRLK